NAVASGQSGLRESRSPLSELDGGRAPEDYDRSAPETQSRILSMKRAILAALPAVLFLASTSCSSVSSSSERLIGGPAYPPTSPSSVLILRREPRKPHERIGHVFVEPSGGPPVEEIENAIRTEAAKLGADAAVIVFDRTRRIGRV